MAAAADMAAAAMVADGAETTGEAERWAVVPVVDSEGVAVEADQPPTKYTS